MQLVLLSIVSILGKIEKNQTNPQWNTEMFTDAGILITEEENIKLASRDFEIQLTVTHSFDELVQNETSFKNWCGFRNNANTTINTDLLQFTTSTLKDTLSELLTEVNNLKGLNKIKPVPNIQNDDAKRTSEQKYNPLQSKLVAQTNKLKNATRKEELTIELTSVPDDLITNVLLTNKDRIIENPMTQRPFNATTNKCNSEPSFILLPTTTELRMIKVVLEPVPSGSHIKIKIVFGQNNIHYTRLFSDGRPSVSTLEIRPTKIVKGPTIIISNMNCRMGLIRKLYLIGIQNDEKNAILKDETTKIPVKVTSFDLGTGPMLVIKYNSKLLCGNNEKSLLTCLYQQDPTLTNLKSESIIFNNRSMKNPELSMRTRRGLLELFHNNYFFASDFTKDLVAKEVDLQQEVNEKTRNEIMTNTDLIKTTTEALSSHITDLQKLICESVHEETIITQKLDILVTIKHISSTIERNLEMCARGETPAFVSALKLQKLCRFHLPEKMCHINPLELRKLYTCVDFSIEGKEKKAVTHLKLNSFKIADVKGAEIHTFPVKIGNKTQEPAMETKYAFQVNNELTLFKENQCEKISDFVMCPEHQTEIRGNDGFCITSLMTNQTSQIKAACNYEPVENRCYSLETDHHLLVSGPGNKKIIRGYKVTTESQTVVIANKRKNPISIECQGQRYKSQPMIETKNVSITHHYNMAENFDHLVEPKRLEKFERKAKELELSLTGNLSTVYRNLAMQESLLHDRNTVNFGSKSFDLKKLTTRTGIAYGITITALFILLLVYVCRKPLKRMCRACCCPATPIGQIYNLNHAESMRNAPTRRSDSFLFTRPATSRYNRPPRPAPRRAIAEAAL